MRVVKPDIQPDIQLTSPVVAPDPRFERVARWRRAGRLDGLKILLDAMLLSVGASLSQVVGNDGFNTVGRSGTAVFVALSLALFATTRSYRVSLGPALLDDVAICFGVTAVATMIIAVVDGVFTAEVPTMGAAIRLWVFSAFYVSAGRIGLLVAQNSLYRSGRALAPTLIVGAGMVGRLAAKRLLESPALGLRPVGFLDKNPLPTESVDTVSGPISIPVLGASWDLEDVVARHGVEHVLLAFSNAPHEVLLDIVRRCDRLGLRVSLVPRLFQRMPSRLAVTHVGGLPLLELQPVDPKSVQYALKYAVDRVAAAFALLVLSPLLAGIALGVLVSLGRPIFYRQQRVGLDGREFSLIKFRSMHPTGDEELTFSATTAPGGVEGVDRRSRTGTFIRTWSLDELPQLFNILKGEMSFVGPRPERPEYVTFFDQHVFRYGERHRIKGGLTGWAQIHGLRGAQSSIADRVEWDNYYVENFSLWLDFKIILRTAAVVLRGDAA